MRLLPTSLAGRLLAGSALFTTLALVFTLVLMNQVLTRFVTGQIDQRLDNKITALASDLRVVPGGLLALASDEDGPPFDRPQHGSFWMVVGARNVLRTHWLTSEDFHPPADIANLAEEPLPPAPPGEPEPPLPPPDAPAIVERARTLSDIDFRGTALHVRMSKRRIGDQVATIFVAAPQHAITGPLHEALTTVGLALAGMGAALVLAAFAQVKLGLRPLRRLRDDVAAISDGRRTSIPLPQPSELMPLAREMNVLLGQQAANLERARRHVANLAHGLKTPLATLSLALDHIDSGGTRQARSLLGEIERRIRHHLGRARTAALDGATRTRTSLDERLPDISGALERIYAERGLTISVNVQSGLTVACEVQDVDEIFGNLLDNACKFARSRIECSATRAGANALVHIADDGPGLTADEIALVLKPGQRLDEAVPGFGFGLAIVRELVELYAGSLDLAEGASGGLSVTVTLRRVFDETPSA